MRTGTGSFKLIFLPYFTVADRRSSDGFQTFRKNHQYFFHVGDHGASCEVAYSASKSGINGFTKALAKELAPSNVQVNAIACGVIDTSMNDQLTSEERKALEEEIPAGRYGTPKEIAQMVWNIVHAPEYMTGQIIGVDGGFL